MECGAEALGHVLVDSTLEAAMRARLLASMVHSRCKIRQTCGSNCPGARVPAHKPAHKQAAQSQLVPETFTVEKQSGRELFQGCIHRCSSSAVICCLLVGSVLPWVGRLHGRCWNMCQSDGEHMLYTCFTHAFRDKAVKRSIPENS